MRDRDSIKPIAGNLYKGISYIDSPYTFRLSEGRELFLKKNAKVSVLLKRHSDAKEDFVVYFVFELYQKKEIINFDILKLKMTPQSMATLFSHCLANRAMNAKPFNSLIETAIKNKTSLDSSNFIRYYLLDSNTYYLNIVLKNNIQMKKDRIEKISKGIREKVNKKALQASIASFSQKMTPLEAEKAATKEMEIKRNSYFSFLFRRKMSEANNSFTTRFPIKEKKRNAKDYYASSKKMLQTEALVSTIIRRFIFIIAIKNDDEVRKKTIVNIPTPSFIWRA